MPICRPAVSRQLLPLHNAVMLLIALASLVQAASAQPFSPQKADRPAYPFQRTHPQAMTRIRPQTQIPFVAPDASATTPNFGGFYAAPYFDSENASTVATLTGDFNHDGKPDVVTINFGSQVSVLLNNGAGGFEAPIITSFEAPYQDYEAASAIVADLNGDGYDDLVIGNQLDGIEPQAPILVILINQKNGTFGDPIFVGGPDRQITTGGRVSTYTFGVAKTTSSGHSDIIISEEYETSSASFETLIQTSLNNGSGVFSPKPMQVISDSSPNVRGYNLTTVFADVNHDGKVDLLLEKDFETSDYVFVMPGNGDGTFQAPTTARTLTIPAPFGNGSRRSTLLAQNLTSDHDKIDLLLSTQYGNIYEAVSNGDGTYQNPKLLLNAEFINEIFAVDVNGDGKADLTTVGDGVLSTFLGNGDGTFSGTKGTALANSDLGGSQSQTALADFNQDGKIDFANGSASGLVELSVGNGDGTFRSAPVYSNGKLLGIGPSILAAPDLNGDGIPDIVAVGSPGLISGLSNGEGGFTYKTALITTYDGYVDQTSGDFNGDGKQDVIMRSLNSDGNNTAAVTLSNGDGTFKSPVFVIQPPTPLACSLDWSAAGDINGDGKLDLIYTYYGDSYCNSGSAVPPGFLIALGNGDGTFKPATFLPSAGGLLPEVIALGHFHGTSSPLDLVAATYDETIHQQALYILQGKGNGTFDSPVLVTNQINSYHILTDDINQDGKADLTLIGENDSTYTAGAFLFTGNGNGTFTPAASLAVPSSNGASAGVYADLNGDGIPDLIDNAESGLLSVYLGTGHGNFASPINYFFDSESGPIVAGKFLGGNALSVIAPTSYDGGTALFMNQGGSTLTVQSSTASSVAGQSLTLASKLTGTLPATVPAQPEPTGTITFYDGTTEIGSTSVDGSFATAKLAVGTHSISAKYSGDAHFNPNTSSPITVKVVAEVLSISLSPASLTFPTTTLGAVSPAQTLTIKNTGNAAVTLTSLKASGTNYAEFATASTTCGSSLAAGTACTASIEFKPTAVGSATATFNVSDNATGSPQHISLAGNSTLPTVSVSPSSLTFPTTKVGATSAAQTITIKNTSQAAVTFTSIKPGGTNYPEFLTAKTTCGTTLAPGASCTASVAFKPSAKGTANATYNFTDNASGTPQKATLTGTAD